MTKPVAVLISDVHYNINTMDVANKAMTMAIDKALELNVDLIVAGDLHDTKANIRGECVIAIQKTFTRRGLIIHVLRGNHDSLNEKSIEHSLNFLPLNCVAYATPQKFERNMLHSMGVGYPDVYLIPYHHDVNELRAYLKTLPVGAKIIMHQGVTDSNSGHYIQDKSALNKEDLAGFKVISGHYHYRQTFKLPNDGIMTYLGNPYTLGFGEANDPPKGFHVLYDDGNLEFIPTNLRKHVIYKTLNDLDMYNRLSAFDYHKDHDLVWVKIEGPKEDMKIVNKQKIAQALGINSFKLELVPLESKSEAATKPNQSQPDLLDNIISSITNVSNEQKTRLKAIWKDLCES